jgi:hypothetical protein
MLGGLEEYSDQHAWREIDRGEARFNVIVKGC